MEKYKELFFGMILLFVIVAVVDHFPYPESFYGYTLILGGVFSFMYWYFKGDKSEAIGLFTGFSIMYMFGLEDVLFFLMHKNIPEQLLNLDSHYIIGTISNSLGYEHVTFTSLSIVALIGIIISYNVVIYLKEAY